MATRKNTEERARRAAAALQAQRAAERRRRLLSITAVVAVIVVIVVGAVLVQQGRDTSNDVKAGAAGSSEYGVTIGPSSAPHEVVVYEDFLCPFCGELERTSRTEFTQLADQGKLRVDYRPFVLLSAAGDYSARATNAFAVVLKTSGEKVAKSFHDVLYENQPSETGPFPTNEQLLAEAVKAGAQESAVKDGILGLSEKSWVDAATKAAIDGAGVSATPTVLLDGKVVNGTPDQIAQQVVDAVS